MQLSVKKNNVFTVIRLVLENFKDGRVAGLDFGLDHHYEVSTSIVTIFVCRKTHLFVELNSRNLHEDAMSNQLLQIIVPKWVPELYETFRK